VMALHRFNRGIPERLRMHNEAPDQLVPPETVFDI